MRTDKPHCPSSATDNVPKIPDGSLLLCHSYFAFRRAIVERVLVHVHILQPVPGGCGAQAHLPIVEEPTQFRQSLLRCQDIFYTLLFRSVLLGVPHSHTVLLWSFLPSLSLLSLPHNITPSVLSADSCALPLSQQLRLPSCSVGFTRVPRLLQPE